MLNHPRDIEYMLVNRSPDFIKWRPFRILGPLFGNGLALSEGDYWKRQRRLAQPAFHRQRIQEYAAVMVEHAARAAARWKTGQTRNIHEEMMLLALDITCSTLFGSDITSDAKEAIQHLVTLQRTFEEIATSSIPLPPFVPTPANLRMRSRVRQLDRILYRMISERRRSNQESNDMLSILLNARDEDQSRMTDQQVRDEVMTLFVAGYETTALTLSWAWFLLSQHPEIEAKLSREICDVTGERPPSLEDFGRLKYTESVIKEVLRLYPPVYAQGREAIRECEIAGYRVPRGTQVFISQWVVHYDARFFAEPAAFRPERWMDGSLDKLPRFAYFPFGGGPRICIGAQFAMMEAVLVMATIRQKFRFSLVPGQRIRTRPAVTLTPDGGIWMLLEAPSESSGQGIAPASTIASRPI
jgi:cytochrome P450